MGKNKFKNQKFQKYKLFPIQQGMEISKVMKEIEKQVEDIEAHEVEELILDSHHFGKFTPELKAKIESYTNLCSLALNDCQLKSLENFPNLPKLAKLELIDNQLAANALNELPSFPELQSLSLGGNRIANIDEITALKRYTQLVELDFLGCHITNIQGYREKLFLEFPNLLILDNADKDGNEVDLDEDMEEDEEDGEDEDNDCLLYTSPSPRDRQKSRMPSSA
eukprot:TRINITY_DN2373_c0_g1_i8.p1 TRINITY_DN2373_c0_g1~~TRINITY_DN2373_c0_g1_i8.p1  ORF type:complete len:223 (-),score=55.43 TRINITY_DN2373_c0_g1_i8:31-699(-)